MRVAIIGTGIAGNAAAWLAGPVIPELRCDLPPGGRLAPPPLTPKRLRYPVLVEQQSLGVTLSMVGERSTALTTGLSILGHRAMQRIRYTEGLSYGVQTRYEQLDGRLAHLIAHTDPLLEHSTQAGSALLDVADVLSLTGPDAAELATSCLALRRSLCPRFARRPRHSLPRRSPPPSRPPSTPSSLWSPRAREHRGPTSRPTRRRRRTPFQEPSSRICTAVAST